MDSQRRKYNKKKSVSMFFKAPMAPAEASKEGPWDVPGGPWGFLGSPRKAQGPSGDLQELPKDSWGGAMGALGPRRHHPELQGTTDATFPKAHLKPQMLKKERSGNAPKLPWNLPRTLWNMLWIVPSYPGAS